MLRDNWEMDNGLGFEQFLSWGFYSLLTGVVAFAVYAVREDFKETTRSLQQLALTVALLTERLASFEKSLDRLEERLVKLEEMGKN